MTNKSNDGIKPFDELFNKYAALVFFDTETSGLDPKEHQIIELAAQRITRTPDGVLTVTKSMDDFIQLRPGEKLPKKIVELTHITDDMLENEGVGSLEAAKRFTSMIEDGPVLLIAHNAHFDLQFTRMLLCSCWPAGMRALEAADYLDSLTVYKDRTAYPHRLANAIEHYGLSGKVQNSHRAIDDVVALVEVCKAMSEERSDLNTYVNIFGYNPKYGVNGEYLEGVTYYPQHFADYLRSNDTILPAVVRRESFRDRI